MADPNSPWQPMDTSTMFDGLAGAAGKLPGKTAAARLNYLQDMMKSMGDPFKSDPAVAPDPYVTAQPSLNRSIYDSNPVLKSGMDLIDQKTDPVSAFEAVKKANPTDASGKDIWTDPATGKPSQNSIDVQKVLHDYAFEVGQNAQDANKANTSIAAKNAKNAKAPGVFDVANAYDLSNQPTVDDLLNQMVNNKAISRSAIPGQGQPTAGAKGSTPLDYASWVKQQQETSPKATTGTANIAPTATGNVMADIAHGVITATSGLNSASRPNLLGYGYGGMSNKPAQSAPTDKAAYAAYVAAQLAKKPDNFATSKGGAAANAAPQQFIGGSRSADEAYRQAAANWINQAKGTTIHSDAYNKAVQTALAMRSMMGS